MNIESIPPESLHSPVVASRVGEYDFEAALQEADRLVEAARTAQAATRDLVLSYHLNTRGFLHLQLGHFKEALADTTEARGLNPDLDQNNLKLANLFANYYDSVIVPEMEKLRDGLSVEPCTKIAMAYHETGFYENAVNYFQLAISVATQEELNGLYDSLAGSYLGAGFLVEAFMASARAIAIEPETDSTNFLLSSWQLQGMGVNLDMLLPPSVPRVIAPQNAIDRPTDETAFYLSKDTASTLDRLNQIIAAERQKLSAAGSGGTPSRLPGFLSQRAFCHLQLGDVDEAIEDHLEARRLDINLDQTNLRLAQFFKAEFETALKPLFDQLAQKISAEVYNKIGVVYFDHHFYGNAATYFQLAASIAEGLVKAESYNDLAGAYLDAGLTIDALRASHQAALLNPDINKVNFNLAVIRLKPMGLDTEELLGDGSDIDAKLH